MTDMLQLIEKAGYKKRESKQINSFLESIGVVDIHTLENCPPKVGMKLFGYDIYSFIAAVRAADKPDKPKEAPVEEAEEVEVTAASGGEES